MTLMIIMVNAKKRTLPHANTLKRDTKQQMMLNKTYKIRPDIH